MNNLSTEPLRVRAEGGFVVIAGPGGVTAPLFPAAAIRIGESPHESGATAYGQVGADPLTGRNLA